MTDATYMEEARGWLAMIASPIAAGEQVPQWLARAARACALPLSRIRGLWYRRIAVLPVGEYKAIERAKDRAAARQTAIAALEHEIAWRAARLEEDREGFVAAHPLMARLVPPASARASSETDEERPVNLYHYLGISADGGAE